MPDVLITPGSIKSLKDCKVGAGGVKDVIEIDIGAGGQVYKVWPSVVPYEDSTDLLKIGGIRYDGKIDDTTGTKGSTSTSWSGHVESHLENKKDVWDDIFWYAYSDVNVAQIEYLYCNYFYSKKGNKDSTYRTGGTFYCSVADDPATNISKDTHRVSYSCRVSTKSSEHFRWCIDMRNITSGILKLGFYGTYGLQETHDGDGDHKTFWGNVHLYHLYAQLEAPSTPSSGIFALSTMT